MQSENKPALLKASVFLVASISLQLLFWLLFRTAARGAGLNQSELIFFAVMIGGYGFLALNLWKLKKWAHRATVVILSLVILTALTKLAKGMSHLSPGYLLFLATYLVTVAFLLTPSVRSKFSSFPLNS